MSPLPNTDVHALGGSGISARMDTQALLGLASELIRLDTVNPPGGELSAVRCVQDFLEPYNIEVEVQEIGSGRANLVARLRGTGAGSTVMLSGHLDTVPVGPGDWSFPPLGAEVRGGMLCGRGAADMKGGVAAMTVALCNLAADTGLSGDVVLALTAGEETDSIGALRLTESGLIDDVGMAIVGEPTGLTVGFAHRGALWIRIDAEGRRAHGSQPAHGDNALQKLLDWLTPVSALASLVTKSDDDVLGCGSLSVNVLNAGEAPNIIPGHASAILDFRTLPAHDHGLIVDALRSRGSDVTISVLRDSRAMMTPREHPLVIAAIRSVEATLDGAGVLAGLPYMTDGSVFADRLGIPVVIMGPGSAGSAHQDNESVPIASLIDAASIYEQIVTELISSDGSPSTGRSAV